MIENGDLILHYLERLGVKYVFGVPGGSIEPLFNALARSERRGGPRAIVARHETGAAFMADGYARETGRIGVCCATGRAGRHQSGDRRGLRLRRRHPHAGAFRPARH